MIEFNNEFMSFLGRGMYTECSKIVIIKIKNLLLSKINEVNKTYYSDNLEDIMAEYLKNFEKSKELMENFCALQQENEDDDQVERLTKLIEVYDNIQES